MNKAESNTQDIRNEKTLVVLMQTGTEKEKQNAFAKLHARHKDAIGYHVQKSFKMNQEISRDIVQEVFIKVFLNINSFNPDCGAFSTWLYKITNNHIIDIKRKGKVEILNIEGLSVNNYSHSDDSNSSQNTFQIEDTSEDNHELMVRNERVLILREAIAAIKNSKSRQAIESFSLLEKSHKEVSKEMNLPIGTVKILILRAKHSIKEYLSEKTVDFEC